MDWGSRHGSSEILTKAQRWEGEMIKECQNTERNNYMQRSSLNSMYTNKIGRVRCRQTHAKSNRAKVRDRWHGHKIYSNTRLHIGDLKKYHMQRTHKVPSTLIDKSTCNLNIKKNHLESIKKVHGTNSIISSVYFILKKYHLN